MDPNENLKRLIDSYDERDEVKAVTAEIEWQYDERWPHGLLRGVLSDGVEIRIYADEEVYDWCDIEPSEEEVENLEVIGVGVRVPGDDEDLDAIWSVGYTDHDGQANAIETAVWYGFIRKARAEIAERERLAGYVETIQGEL
jgi:hypothetical protein